MTRWAWCCGDAVELSLLAVLPVFAAPALAAGNGIVLKHAANVPQCLLAMGELMAEIGLPDGLCATILAGPDAVMRLIAR